MTTNKPEVVAYATHHDEPMLFPSMKEAAAYCEDEEEPVALIRLSDYEALQAENERLRSILIDLKDWDCDVNGGFLSIPLGLRRRMQNALAAQAQPKHRPYNASGSLSEYGVSPECDAQQPADDEVVFIDGVGAGRSSVKSCRDGVQWIRVGDRVYWPLSDSDAKRLQSACCGNGSFDGPATPASEGEQP